uniref:Uncharacterized protein n=1 Tax=Sphaerodactylus townsendi TaxID=933632 RepID=A0ACB8G7C0_9SAUR
MQDPNLVEMSSSVEGSNCSFLQCLSAEICTVSFPGAGEEPGRDRSSQNGQLGGLETVQENFPSEDGGGGDFEASWDCLPDAFAAESSNAWGDFESFREVKVDSQSHTPELLENLNGEQTTTRDIDIKDNHFATSCEQIFSRTAGHPRRDACLNVPVKATLNSEDVLKLSFPEVPVPQFSENISGLNEMLETKTEDADIPEHTKMQPW